MQHIKPNHFISLLVSVLRTTYLALCWKLFIESVLKYTCTLKKIENVRKCEKKWGFKKLYTKSKN